MANKYKKIEWCIGDGEEKKNWWFGFPLQSMKHKLAWCDASVWGKWHSIFCLLSMALLLPFHRQIESKANLNCTTV